MQKLAAHDARVDQASEKGAFTVSITAKDIDKKGNVKSTTEEVEKVRHDGGDTQIEVVRAVKDGKDITQEQREQVAAQQEKRKHDKKKQDEGKLQSPFAREQQPHYNFWTLGPAGDHRLRIGFAPSSSPTPQTYRGEAIVDTTDGAPVSMKFSPAKMPPHADRVDISLEYAQPGHMLSKMVVDGEGSFLFMHKHMLVTTSFSDYH